jgi:glyoxylase-like metal-dependent hydrolase (beta-lactamase superfamily II)
MAFEEIMALFGNGSDLIRQRLNAEIQRLQERGLIESGEAEELKGKFLKEVDKQTRRSVDTMKTVGVGVGSLVRELLDIPSRSELQQFMESMDGHLRDATRPQAAYNIPVHNPGALAKPGVPVEILPGIHTWSVYSEEKGLHFNSYWIETAKGHVAIDPVDPGTDEWRNAILDLGSLKKIIVTNRDHVRATPWLAKASKAKIVMHEREAVGELNVHEQVKDGDRIFEELRVIDLAGKSPGEMGLLRERDGGQLIIGDALIGRPVGSVTLLPESKLDDPLRLRRSLRNLLDEQFDALLLAVGASVLAQASSLTHAFLRTL